MKTPVPHAAELNWEQLSDYQQIEDLMITAERRDKVMETCVNLDMKIIDMIPMHEGKQIARFYLPRSNTTADSPVDSRCFVLSEN